MEFEQITTELSDHVLTITMNRPDRLNAWTRTMFGELMQAFERADADDEVRAVIVTGAGRAFCAGADLEGGAETFARREHDDPDSIPRDGGGRLTLRIFELGELLDAATALAREIADNAAPVSLALARRMMWTMLGAEHPMLAHRADSRGMFYRGRSADAAEGIAAFLEKRRAEFPDKVSDGLPDVLPGWTAPEFG